MIDIEAAISTLAQHRVEFVLIGGVALSLHSAAYVTYDIDICYSRQKDNVIRLADALRLFNPRPRGFPKDLPFVWDARTLRNSTSFTLNTDIGDFDMLAEVNGVGSYDEVLAKSESWTIFGRDVHVLSIDGLIAAKEAANREKDVPGLKILHALRESTQDEG